MNKMELIAAVADTTDLPRAKASEVVDAVLGAIEGALKKKEEVRLVGFGTFATSARAADHRAQPAHRGGNADPRLDLGEVQGREGAEGRCSVISGQWPGESVSRAPSTDRARRVDRSRAGCLTAIADH